MLPRPGTTYITLPRILDELDTAFRPNGSHPMSFDELHEFATTLYHRWMTERALLTYKTTPAYTEDLKQPIYPSSDLDNSKDRDSDFGDNADDKDDDYVSLCSNDSAVDDDDPISDGPGERQTTAATGVPLSRQDDWDDNSVPLEDDPHLSGERDDESEWSPEDELLFAGTKSSTRDERLHNSIMFMIDAWRYLEFNDAVREGDIGRVYNILKVRCYLA